MKKIKEIKIITIILIVALIILTSFFGVYVKKQNRMENQVKDYLYGMDLEGVRNITLKVSSSNRTIMKDSEGKVVENDEELTEEEMEENGYVTEEIPYNNEEDKNTSNYKIAKNILEKRLNKLGVEKYTIRLNEENGEIEIDIPENKNTDTIVSNIYTTGKFEIIDEETREVLMNNDDIKLANVAYSSGQNPTTNAIETSVYLNIEFNKEGTKKLEEISNKYVRIENEEQEEVEETDENQTEEETVAEKKIALLIDDEEIMSTSFEETIKTGKMPLSFGQATSDKTKLDETITKASNMANVLDQGNIPLKYELDENQYVLSDITKDDLKIINYVIIAIVILLTITLIVKYKIPGLLVGISYVGLVSLLSLVIKYTNVILTIEGIVGIVLIIGLNYKFNYKLLKKINNKMEKTNVKNAIKENYIEFFIKIIPIIILAIAFCFIKWVAINSFGMVMFWGIALIAIYNIIITNTLLKLYAK